MSVASHLGLQDPDTGLLVQARGQWAHWTSVHPVLEACPDLLAVPAWTRTAPRDRVNEVLLALGQLGAQDGDQDPAATAALAWILLDGAGATARRLRRYSDRIEQVVAAQLWIEARTVRWRTGYDVAANIFMNTRKGVLRELGVPGKDRDTRDRAWAARQLVDDWNSEPALLAASTVEEAPSDAGADLLYDLLDEAAATGLLTRDDCACLLELAQGAHDGPQVRAGRGYAGILAEHPTRLVAARRGQSARTVARQARRAIDLLRSTYADQPAA